MKKGLTNIFLVLVLILVFTVPVFASGLNNPSLPRIVDNADMFTDAEEKLLADELSKLIEKYDYDFFIMTANDHGSASSDEEFIEGVWDVNGFGVGSDRRGWAIFVCLQDRTWIHDACGKATEYLSYDSVNIIDDFMEPYMVNGDYYGAMMSAISELDSLFELGEKKYVDSTYSPIVDPPGPTPSHEPTVLEKLRNGGISGVIAGLLAGLISVGSAKKSMKTVSRAYSANNYARSGSFRLWKKENILLDVHTQRIEKAQAPPPSSGGPHHSGGSSYSAPHTSSGGFTHSSGGGRHF